MTLDEIFEKAVELTLAEEGGWVNNPADHGGATNMGVTIGELQSLGEKEDFNNDGKVDVVDLKIMTRDQAKAIYKEKYWMWDKFPNSSALAPAVLAKIFDIGVNMGPSVAIKLLQKAVNGIVPPDKAIDVDGVLGPTTINTAANCHQGLLLNQICEVQKERYEAIVAHSPSQKIFLKGWLARAARKPNF